MQHRVKRRIIAMLVAEAFDVLPSLLDGPSRSPTVTRARFAAWLLIRFYWHGHSRASTSELGRLFGDRDHSTVVHGLRRAAELLFTDEDFAGRVREARHSIRAQKPRNSIKGPLRASDLVWVAPRRETPPAVNVVPFEPISKPSPVVQVIERRPGEDHYEFWRRESCWNSEQRFLALAMAEHPNLVRVPQKEAAE